MFKELYEDILSLTKQRQKSPAKDVPCGSFTTQSVFYTVEGPETKRRGAQS